MSFNRLIGLGVVAVGLVGIGSAAMADTTLRLACPSAPTNSTCMAASRFAEEANRLSNGAVTVKVFPSGQLGTGTKAIQQTQAGIIDVVVESLSNYSALVNDYNVVSWGFVFRDADHYDTFLKSPIHAKMMQELETKHGIRLLATNWRKLPRVVVATKPVFTPDDLKGLKFRVPGIPAFIKTWSAVGANPAQVPWGESFQALKTGVVDAMEAPYDSVVSQKFHLAAPYVTLTNHVFTSIVLGINAKKFASLSAEDQKALSEAATAATDYSAELAAESAKTIEKDITDSGAYIITLNPKKFREKVDAATGEQEAAGTWSKGLVAEIQALK